MAARARLRWLAALALAYTWRSSVSTRPANLDSPASRNPHFSGSPVPGRRLVTAIAPALTIGLVVPSGLRSMADTELNGSPVAFTPILVRAWSGPSTSKTSANTNGFATLMIVNSCPASPARYHVPLVPATQMPNRSLGSSASAGYVREFVPSLTWRYFWYASSTRCRTSAAGGRWPVETYPARAIRSCPGRRARAGCRAGTRRRT